MLNDPCKHQLVYMDLHPRLRCWQSVATTWQVVSYVLSFKPEVAGRSSTKGECYVYHRKFTRIDSVVSLPSDNYSKLFLYHPSFLTTHRNTWHQPMSSGCFLFMPTVKTNIEETSFSSLKTYFYIEKIMSNLGISVWNQREPARGPGASHPSLNAAVTASISFQHQPTNYGLISLLTWKPRWLSWIIYIYIYIHSYIPLTKRRFLENGRTMNFGRIMGMGEYEPLRNRSNTA